MDIGKDIAANYPLIGQHFLWLSIPLYAAVAWIFHTMERIGRTGENPFEGTSNDVPISTIARGIEIDLRQNLGERKEESLPSFRSIWVSNSKPALVELLIHSFSLNLYLSAI